MVVSDAVIRDAGPGDLEEICLLVEEHARFEGNDELRVDRDELGKHLFGPEPRSWVLIAEVAGAVAGMAFCAWTLPTWQAVPGIWLDDLFVRPEYRRHGVGRAFMTALRGRTDGRIEWEMQEGNDNAAAFYESLGAKPVQGWVRYRWNP